MHNNHCHGATAHLQLNIIIIIIIITLAGLLCVFWAHCDVVVKHSGKTL